MLRALALSPAVVAAATLLFAAERTVETVVYTALRPNDWDICRFESAGKPARRLTSGPGLDYNPAISPDGRWLVFCSERNGNPDLFLVDLKNPGTPRLLLGGAAMEDAPTFSPDGRQLAFVSTREGNADIYVVAFDSRKKLSYAQAKNLTGHSRGDFNPAFSPDGKWIAFASDRDGYKASEIYLMKSDGSQVSRLTRSAGWDGSPAWARDGKTIYFYSERDGKPRVYRINRDGTAPSPLTPKGAPALSPAVSAKGRVAFAILRKGKWRIESMAADGSGLRVESSGDSDYWAPSYDPQTGQLICHGAGVTKMGKVFRTATPGPFLIDDRTQVRLSDRTLRVAAIRGYFPAINHRTGELLSGENFDRIVVTRLDGAKLRESFKPENGKTWRPACSKDGRWMACTVGPTFGKPKDRADIWKARLDGKNRVNLTQDSTANDAFPDFSPDGRWIVFRSGRNGNHDIYLMDADGSHVRQLTKHEATDTMPAFSPEGRRIAFTSQRDGDYEIYLLHLSKDGAVEKLQRVTRCPGRDMHPKFSPDGKWLVIASERGGMNDESPLIPVFNPQPYGDIYALRLADGKVVRLTHNKWEDGTPAWGVLPTPAKTDAGRE